MEEGQGGREGCFFLPFPFPGIHAGQLWSANGTQRGGGQEKGMTFLFDLFLMLLSPSIHRNKKAVSTSPSTCPSLLPSPFTPPRFALSPFLPHSLPSLGLSSSFNLGKADIYPSTSGKAAAVARFFPRLFLHPDQCVALFDDDNDLGMATLCQTGRRIAVSITHPSVQAYVAGDKRVETVSRPGILGSEEALERVLVSLGRIH